MNEFTAGQSPVTRLLHVRYDGDDDGDVGMRALTLVRGLLFSTELGERFMVRRRCTGSKINALSELLHRCMTV